MKVFSSIAKDTSSCKNILSSRISTVLSDSTIHEDTQYLADKISECMDFVEDCENKWGGNSRAINQLSQMQMVHNQLDKCYDRLRKVL